MCIVGAQVSAEESLLHGYGRSGVNKMFLDAHAPDIPPRYSRAEIKHKILDAKTSEDFERLADYFDYQALDYQRNAKAHECSDRANGYRALTAASGGTE
jgi:hypothetical protein